MARNIVIVWDEKLSLDILKPRRQLESEYPVLQQLSIPRFFYTQCSKFSVLCSFYNAYEQDYATIIYLWVNNSSCLHP